MTNQTSKNAARPLTALLRDADGWVEHWNVLAADPIQATGHAQAGVTRGMRSASGIDRAGWRDLDCEVVSVAEGHHRELLGRGVDERRDQNEIAAAYRAAVNAVDDDNDAEMQRGRTPVLRGEGVMRHRAALLGARRTLPGADLEAEVSNEKAAGAAALAVARRS